MGLSEAEATLDQNAFDAIAALAHREFGLHIAPEKIKMVQSRLRRRLGELNFRDFKTYSNFVCSVHGKNERRSMVSALTTNVTSFFREPHHFDFLSEHMVSGFQSKTKNNERLRIWSAGCSNGQEPYSIAMHLISALPSIDDADFKILATDVDPKVIAFATQGEYSSQLLSSVPEKYEMHFDKMENKTQKVSAKFQKIISFRELNLLGKWPMRFQFDAIFCRNVLIYFDLQTQENLWPKFHEVLKPGGFLFLGHSERISNPEKFGFETTGSTTYKKIGKRR